MIKQTSNDFTAINASQNQFKESRKNMSVKKNPRYIYTEDDLGEGLLDAGIISPFENDQQDKLHTQPWITMLKTRWA